MDKLCGNCGGHLWSVDLVNKPPCGCGWQQEERPPAIKMNDPVRVKIRTSNVVVEGHYIEFSERNGENTIHLKDGAVLTVRAGTVIKAVLPGQGSTPLVTVKGHRTNTEYPIGDIFEIMKD